MKARGQTADTNSKSGRAASKKVKKRKASTPLPETLGDCFGGDVVIHDEPPFFGEIEVSFRAADCVAVRRFGPPTRDRAARREIIMLPEDTAISVIVCPHCNDTSEDTQRDCPACDGSLVIGLMY